MLWTLSDPDLLLAQVSDKDYDGTLVYYFCLKRYVVDTH